MSALVHRSRFVDWAPAGITDLAWTPTSWQEGEYLAVGRAKGDIELWIRSSSSSSRAAHYTCARVIPGLSGSSVESLIWTHQVALDASDCQLWTEDECSRRARQQRALPPRLFTTGLSDRVIEWDIERCRPKASLESQGGPVWSLCTNASNTTLAMGCDDGTIRLVDLADGEFQYQRALSKVKGRIISMAWDEGTKANQRSNANGVLKYSKKDHGTILSGHSDSSLRLWDVSSGRVLAKMLVDKVAGEQSIVWAVAFLGEPDSKKIAVSGDSTGAITFWNLDTFSVLQTFRSHAADILCLVISPSQNEIYTSGVDRKVIQYRRTAPDRIGSDEKSKKSRPHFQWIVSCAKAIHQHDVRTMTISRFDRNQKGFELLSGGNDLAINVQKLGSDGTLFKSEPHHRLSYAPSPRQGRGGPVLFAPKAKLLGCVSESSISLWSIKQAGSRDMIDRRTELTTPEKSLQMTFKLASNIISSALSSNGKFLALSDTNQMRIYLLKKEGTDGLKPHKLKGVPRLSAASLHFMSEDPDRLIVGDRLTGQISLWTIARSSVSLLTVLQNKPDQPIGDAGSEDDMSEVEDESIDPAVMIVSHLTGQFIAALTIKNDIHIYDVAKQKIHATLSAPSLQGFPTVIAFHPVTLSLVIVFSDNRFIIYNVVDRQINGWSRKNGNKIPARLVEEGSRIHGIAFNQAPRTKLNGTADDVERIGDTEFILWGPTFTCRVDLDKPMPPTPAPKSHRKTVKKRMVNGDSKTNHRDQTGASEEGEDEDDDDDDAAMLELDDEGVSNFKITHRFRDMIYFDFIGPDEILVVERPYWDIAQSMPGAFWRSGQYGR